MTTVMVGERGQITIPKDIRKRLKINPKEPVSIEMTENGVLIRPLVTVSLRSFPDDVIEKITSKDALGAGERQKILKKWIK